MASSRQNLFHRDFGGGEQQVERLHRGRVEDLQLCLGRDRLLARVDDVRHHPDCVVVVDVARHVGHDHHRLGAGEGVFLVAGLTLLGVGQKHQLPARERVRHGEAEGRAAVGVGAQLREEEGRLIEVLAERGLGGCRRLLR